jgi:hypothetical protein
MPFSFCLTIWKLRLSSARTVISRRSKTKNEARFQREGIVARPQALEDHHVVVFGRVEIRAVTGGQGVGHLGVIDLDAEQAPGPALPALGLAAQEVEPDVALFRHVLQPVVHDRRLAAEAVVDFHAVFPTPAAARSALP